MKKTNIKNKPSKSIGFRNKWMKKGYELINITPLCEAVLGNSGWCNDFNEPDESIHHIQIRYRGETIANVCADGIFIIDEKKYVLFQEEDPLGNDFIIYRKLKC